VTLIVTGDPGGLRNGKLRRRLSPSNESQPLLTCNSISFVLRTMIIVSAYALIIDSLALAVVITREFIHCNSNYDQNDRSSGRNDHSNDVEKQRKTHLE
jgi:hypothetical protein